MQIVDVSTPVDKETEGVICGKAGLYIGLHKVNFPIHSVILISFDSSRMATSLNGVRNPALGSSPMALMTGSHSMCKYSLMTGNAR